MKYKIIWMSLLLMAITAKNYSEITYIPLNKARISIWEAESLFLGGSMKVVNSNEDVIVIRKENKPRALGVLYFMLPTENDSVQFLFHNMKEKFMDEADRVNLGKFPKNTKIIFRYVITDTSSDFMHVKGKKYYTGQNRTNVDKFVSDNDGPMGKMFAIVGSLGNNRCEVGFSAAMPGDYSDIRFNVTNVKVDKD